MRRIIPQTFRIKAIRARPGHPLSDKALQYPFNCGEAPAKCNTDCVNSVRVRLRDARLICPCHRNGWKALVQHPQQHFVSERMKSQVFPTLCIKFPGTEVLENILLGTRKLNRRYGYDYCGLTAISLTA